MMRSVGETGKLLQNGLQSQGKDGEKHREIQENWGCKSLECVGKADRQSVEGMQCQPTASVYAQSASGQASLSSHSSFDLLRTRVHSWLSYR